MSLYGSPLKHFMRSVVGKNIAGEQLFEAFGISPFRALISGLQLGAQMKNVLNFIFHSKKSKPFSF